MSKKNKSTATPPTVNHARGMLDKIGGDARRLRLNASDTLVANLMSRYDLMESLIDPKRNIDAECGYSTPTIETMNDQYRNGDIAKRVVSVWSDETWLVPPTVYETEHAKDTKFEAAWKELNRKFGVLALLQRADELSGIGRFGVVLLGFDDGKELNEPVSGVTDTSDLTGDSDVAESHDLIYMRTYSERSVRVKSYVTDDSSPRFGQPKTYEINQFLTADLAGSASTPPPTEWKEVHWTRILHLADNRKESEVFGEPRMKLVWKRLHDLRKTYGAAGEGYWKGGVPAYAFAMNPDVKDAKIDTDSVRSQMDMFANGLQKYLALENLTVNPLDVKLPSPKEYADAFIGAICIALNIPVPVFVGSITKDTDMSAWNLRLRSRQENYAAPYILRPYFNRLFAAGALPKPKKGVFIQWLDLNGPTEDQRATIAQKRAQALSQYAGSNSEWLMGPHDFFQYVLGLTEEESDYLASKVDESAMQEKRDAELAAMNPDDPTGSAPPDNKTVTSTKGVGGGALRDETQRRPKNYARRTQL